MQFAEVLEDTWKSHIFSTGRDKLSTMTVESFFYEINSVFFYLNETWKQRGSLMMHYGLVPDTKNTNRLY